LALVAIDLVSVPLAHYGRYPTHHTGISVKQFVDNHTS